MAWWRLCVFGKHGPERDVPAVLPKPSHCATHRVLVLRHALQEDSSAVLVLGEVGALLQLLDECHTGECRLVRRRVAASRHTQLVVELAPSGHSCAEESQSSHERLAKALERLQQVYRCLSVYLGCATNSSWDGSSLSRRNRKTERRAQVCFAEAVSAYKLPFPLEIAQRDMLSIEAHAL